MSYNRCYPTSMEIITQKHEIITSQQSLDEMVKIVERFGRKCWKSEDRISECSADPFIRNIRGKHHDSVIEHTLISVDITTSRAMAQQITRHRLAAYSMESQRYVNYTKEKFGGVRFIQPVDFNNWKPEQQQIWVEAMRSSEEFYFFLVKSGLKPEEARDALNNACATTFGMSANARVWNHIFKERCSNGAQKQVRALFMGIREDMQKMAPALFDEIK